MRTQTIHLQMNVADLLNEWPQVIPVFLKRRMACVGCSMASFETLGGAAKIYHIPPQDFLDDLYRAIQSDTDESNPGESAGK